MYSRAQPSQAYLDGVAWAVEFHRTHKTFTGLRLLKSYTPIKRLTERHAVATMLDYGAGKGLQYGVRDFPNQNYGVVPSLAEGLGVKVTLFEPGWPPFATLPTSTFDCVVCTDVLEYIPREDMVWVLAEILGFADKFAFCHTHTNMSSKKAPPGRDQSERTIDWWLAQFCAAGKTKPTVEWVAEITSPGVDASAFSGHGEIYQEAPELIVDLVFPASSSATPEVPPT